MHARDARPDDHARFLELLEELDLPAADPRPDRESFEREWLKDTFFVEDAGRAVGYGTIRAAGDLGLVLHVVADRAVRRRGVGRAVMTEATRRLRAAGCSEWLLNVRPANAAAIALYESMGMTRRTRSASIAIGWPAARSLAREASLAARVVEPVEDEGYERAFALTRGRLAELRGRPGRVLLGVPERALACFDPGFPGATPFRARSIAAASALVDAIRAHAPGEERPLRLHVEDDPGLERALIAAGGTTIVELVQMRGPIPA